MRGFIDRLFSNEKQDSATHLAPEALLSLEYSSVDRKLLSTYLACAPHESTDLGRFMQYCLSEVKTKAAIPLEEECLNLTKYVRFFEHYFGNELNVSFDFPVKPHDFSIPPFLLFPLVQNAFYFGYHAARQYPVRIKGKLLGDTLVLEVSNRVNHHIVDQAKTELIQYFNSRLMYAYKDRFDLILNSNSNTFKATLRLKLTT